MPEHRGVGAECRVMKTYLWQWGLALVFVVSGLLAVASAAWNLGMLTWSAAEGLRLHDFPSGAWRMVAGAAGLLLAGAGLATLRGTWKDYRRARAWAKSPWKKFCRAEM